MTFLEVALIFKIFPLGVPKIFNLKFSIFNLKVLSMIEAQKKHWYFNKQIDLSVLVQIVFLAILIVGSWVNLQKQLSSLQHDITGLIETQKQFQQRVEELSRTSISYEYRLRSLEKQLPAADIGKNGKL
jgi:hypothetical protein